MLPYRKPDFAPLVNGLAYVNVPEKSQILVSQQRPENPTHQRTILELIHLDSKPHQNTKGAHNRRRAPHDDRLQKNSKWDRTWSQKRGKTQMD